MTDDQPRPIIAYVEPIRGGGGHWLVLDPSDKWPQGKRIQVHRWRGMHDNDSMTEVSMVLRDWGYILGGIDPNSPADRTVFLIAEVEPR